MNYLEQIKGFWIAQEAYQLGTSEIALYLYLLEVCNKTGWTGTFNRNNYKVMSDLSIRSYKTLQSIRDKLSNAQVLVFVQKNGDANVAYTLADLGKKYLGYGDKVGKNYQGKGEGLGKGKGKGSYQGSGKVNINQTENQTKPNTSNEGGTAPPDEESEVPFWKKFVGLWKSFYKQKFEGNEYLFSAKDWSALKKIYQFLQKRALQKKYEWTEQVLVDGFTFFLNKAFEKDNWSQANFSLPKILGQFNEIANGQANSNHKQSATSQVSTASAFDKIDRMSG